MTRKQRHLSQQASELRAALDVFEDNPCRLSSQQTHDLLTDLCVRLSYCLSTTDCQTIEANPPTDPLTFAELVMRLEGVGADNSDALAPVLERVLEKFQQVAEERATTSRNARAHCCTDMARSVSTQCDEHADRFDCPDALLHYSPKFCEYGLIVHDGGTATCLIQFCPWCGTQLPESQRTRWFDELERLGFSDPNDPAIPQRFLSDEWWKN
ncbi:MAG: hypothetical protein QM756_35210 [Polyangiaceae bacterium]